MQSQKQKKKFILNRDVWDMIPPPLADHIIYHICFEFRLFKRVLHQNKNKIKYD